MVVMSGSYIDAAGPTIAADAAETAAGVAEATAWTAQSQADTAGFINAHGAAVTAGHSDVGVLLPSIAGNE
jgi:predicted trehalose synthase